MLLNWVVLFKEVASRNRRMSRDPMADPLDGPEWRGLLWIIPIMTRLAARRSETRRTHRDSAPIARSLSFRSSIAARGAGIPD
ncbi:hypothetical protein [Rhizobium lentis]|uniref:Uncharacterized protein n=1 Tax=Rhizobium lentis TaxID=1138194 RepID=A0A9Q3MAT8_9HYPH|nr:hypothetical protein [Rhizobium lentis]MBX5002004.1 hypothetical protein [Rhizobium lentis]MBX5009774.1 hypothetical protein [Rhizobium lentis]MBX5018873.1 hypothetical protein [Rhizobium lentis]MBX5022781.1 hypothetical protein [Rhizobium lentis]MBX5047839.1 hypothetical protein [Rhizobium lentis]